MENSELEKRVNDLIGRALHDIIGREVSWVRGVQDLKDGVSTAVGRLETLEAQLQVTNTALTQEISTKEGRIEALNERIQKVGVALSTKEKLLPEIMQLEAKRDSLKTEISDLEAQLASIVGRHAR